MRKRQERFRDKAQYVVWNNNKMIVSHMLSIYSVLVDDKSMAVRDLSQETFLSSYAVN